MAERRLVIKEMWNEFSGSWTGPVKSAAKRKEQEELFYAGAIGMLRFMVENPAAPLLVDDVLREAHGYCDEIVAKAKAGGYA